MKRLHSPVNKSKEKDNVLYSNAVSSIIVIMCCMVCFLSASWAWFTSTASVTSEPIVSATYKVEYVVYEKGDETKVVTADEEGNFDLDPAKIYVVKLTPEGTASTGYAKFSVDGEDYTTIQLEPESDPITFEVSGYDALKAEFSWGIAQASPSEEPVENEDEIYKDITVNYYSFGSDASVKPVGTASEICATKTEKANKILTSMPESAPEYTGYSFDCWTLADGTPFDPATDTFYQETSLYASYNINQYDYSFIASGTPIASGKADYDSDISALVPTDDPTAPEGKYFDGWSATDGGTTKVEDFGKISTDTTKNTFYAIFKDNEVTTVKFFEYDGSNEHGPATGNIKEVIVKDCAKQFGETTEPEIGSKLILPETEPVLANYKFAGWFDADGNEWTADSDIPNAELNLYAKYTRVQCGLVAIDGSTTVIERGSTDKLNNLDDVASYTAESVWYVYGLKVKLSEDDLLGKYVTVAGDCRIELVRSSKNFYGTGSTITVIDNITNEVVEKFYIIIFGDIDGSGTIVSKDTTMCSEEELGITTWSLKKTSSYDPIKVKAADLNGDGRIKSKDTTIISEKELGTGDINQVTGRYMEVKI